MKKLLVSLVFMMLLSLGMTSTGLAQHGEAIRGCPNQSFELHHAHEHDGDHEGHHRHIGSNTDRNGDGYICVKELPGDKHLHIDNNKPFK